MPSNFHHGIDIGTADLTTLPFDRTDDGQIFGHDGSSALSMTDGTTSAKEGLFIYNHTATPTGERGQFAPAGVYPKMSSTAPSDVTGSRTAGTWYQNTSSDTRYVTVIVSGSAGVDVAVDVNDSQTANVVTDDHLPDDGTTTFDGTATVTISVPRDQYYRINLTAGSIDAVMEYEQTLVIDDPT